MTRFLFRTDANTVIGAGHLMRCLALADTLLASGSICVFLCRGDGLGNLANLITASGHQLMLLPTIDAEQDGGDLPHSKWLPGGQVNDAAACIEILSANQPADWLVVDHYSLDKRWESVMRAVASRIMVIDDLADRVHDCDLLLDQSFIENMKTRYENLIPTHCVRLLGPQFALLRAEFASDGGTAQRIKSDYPRVLIMFGGSDTQNLTLRTVEQLVKMNWLGFVDVVVGPLYNQLTTLEVAVSNLASARLHAPSSQVAELMRQADLSIGSPGVASWERCACGLPALTMAQANNQEGIGIALGRIGANFYLGPAEFVADDELRTALSVLLANEPARQAMALAAAAVCDGHGSRRVKGRLLQRSFTIRRVTLADADMLYSWRNDERTRRYSADSRPLTLTQHLAWINRTLSMAEVDLLLACCEDEPVTCLRFDRIGSKALVSIYTNPDNHGRGLNVGVLRTAIDWLRTNHPEIDATEAEVLAGNDASHTLFAAAGFHPIATRYMRQQ